MSNFDFFTYDSTDGLVTLTINKPPFNVLDIPAMKEMNRALDLVLADESAKVLLITGAGEKAFSAGVEVADHTPDKVDDMIETFHGIFKRLQQMPIPTVAALNGVALGGGCEVALGCDMIVSVERAKIGQPEIQLGVFPPIAAILLPKMMPSTRATELLLGGGVILAEEAQSLGLVNRVFARDAFAEGCREFVGQFLGLSRVALMATKKAMVQASGKGFFEALPAVEDIYLKELMITEDAKEGLASFMEKRKPVWKNR